MDSYSEISRKKFEETLHLQIDQIHTHGVETS